MVQTMAPQAIVFACANPTPEIDPKDAKAGGAAVVATGRSDYPNQINNVLAFPGIFRGTFDVHAKEINDEMKFAAATAIASIIPDDQIRADYSHPLPDGIDGPLQRDPSRLLVSPQAGQEPCLHQRPLASPYIREWGECTEHSVWD